MSYRQRQRRRHRSQRGAGRAIFLAAGVVFSAGVLAILGVVGWVVGIAASAPALSTLKPTPQGSTSAIYAADGKRLGFVQSAVLRSPIPRADIPTEIKQATVAIEDKRFYEHKGVDFQGIVRAALKNVQSHQTVQGGSTLTMQLVKNLYEKRALQSGKDRTFKVKIQEAKLAEDLENKHPGLAGKEWVLAKYLNNVPYGTVGGQTAVGIQAAARLFFDKPARRLTLPESALLAGLPQAPSQYSPYLNPQSALSRRNEVLGQMAKQGMLTPVQAVQAESAPLGLRHNRYYTRRHEGYFFDYVQSELVRRYGYEAVRRGGLQIYTTLDLKQQVEARTALANSVSGTDRDSALVSMEAATGYIRAMASSRRYGDLKFNLAAQGHRQPGSTFKVMVLMTALRKGVDPTTTTYTSMPLRFTDPTYGLIDVKTYEGTYEGRMNLVTATLKSDNTVYEQLDLDVGPQEVRKTAYDMGITTHLNGYPAEGLGGLRLGVSPLEMARAYSSIANGGYRVRPIAVTKIVFPDGHSEVPYKPTKTRIFSDGVAYEATKILEDNMRAGTGISANYGCPAGGKTGTTDSFTDAWFVGFSPKVTTAVWVGHANSRESMPGAQGAVAAAPYWGEFMRAAHGSYCGDFPLPKVPFRPVPFFGRYARQGVVGNAPSSSAYPPSGTTTPAPAPAPAPSTGQGGQTYDPSLYATPPQQTPSTPPATPAPSGSGGAGAGGVQAPGQ